MIQLRFSKSLYSKIALIKAAYNFTDKAYIHLDADDKYYYVVLENKDDNDEITEQEFKNEMLTQTARHEIYLQTKNIRELLLARSLASSVIIEGYDDEKYVTSDDEYSENEILKDWFDNND